MFEVVLAVAISAHVNVTEAPADLAAITRSPAGRLAPNGARLATPRLVHAGDAPEILSDWFWDKPPRAGPAQSSARRLCAPLDPPSTRASRVCAFAELANGALSLFPPLELPPALETL